MRVEDAERSRSPVGDSSPHYPVFPEFRGASYLDRYHLLCEKLMKEQFYTAATVLASPRTAAKTGEFSTHDDLTSLTRFVANFAGHIAAVAAAS